jgi:hypothetical protein
MMENDAGVQIDRPLSAWALKISLSAGGSQRLSVFLSNMPDAPSAEAGGVAGRRSCTKDRAFVHSQGTSDPCRDIIVPSLQN